MNDITIKRLRDAGWYKNRKINIDLIKQKYKEIGLVMPVKVSEFLEEFAMLNINAPDKKYFDVEFDPLKAIGINLSGEYFEKCLSEYGINETAYPIGTACRDNLCVLMLSNGSVYCFTDGCLVKAGAFMEEMLDCLVGEYRLPEDIE